MNVRLVFTRLMALFSLFLLIAAGMIVYSGGTQIYQLLRSLGLMLVLVLFLLAPFNYLLRWLKWRLLLHRLDLKLSVRSTGLVFLAGLGLAVLPGKVGELAKSLLLWELEGVEINRTLPAVIVLRYTDVLSVVVLALLGSRVFPWATWPLLTLLVALLCLGYTISSPWLLMKIVSLLPEFLRKRADFIKSSQEGIQRLLRPAVFLPAIVIGMASWAFEGAIVYLALGGLGIKVSPLASLFVVSFSTVSAGLTMLPGGLGAAELSIMSLLASLDVDRDIGALITLLTRLSTVWLGVLLGSCALYIIATKIEKGRKQ